MSKSEFELFAISISHMIELEKNHLAFLKKQKPSKQIEGFIKRSENDLAHYELRYKEYIAYINKNVKWTTF